jgi:hypothetical protein
MRLAPAPGPGGAPATPRERCAPGVRDLMARSLANVSNGLPRWSIEALRIGFEAHCMYALSSSEDQPDLDAWHFENARPWGLLLHALINACKEQGKAELAADLDSWYEVASSRINPFHDPHYGR